MFLVKVMRVSAVTFREVEVGAISVSICSTMMVLPEILDILAMMFEVLPAVDGFDFGVDLEGIK